MKRTPLRRKSKSPLAKLKQQLWDECRRITRARYGNTCYTCGRAGLEGSNWQTGHFISSSICSVHLRYHLDNLRPQCYNCNINKSGNWIAFEAHLIVEKGRDFPEQLKQLNRETTGRQYDSTWYLEKIEEYKQYA
jgi:5-methylcytosine-specific restriction endonuclease McrA